MAVSEQSSGLVRAPWRKGALTKSNEDERGSHLTTARDTFSALHVGSHSLTLTRSEGTTISFNTPCTLCLRQDRPDKHLCITEPQIQSRTMLATRVTYAVMVVLVTSNLKSSHADATLGLTHCLSRYWISRPCLDKCWVNHVYQAEQITPNKPTSSENPINSDCMPNSN
jgi:hypothetical protein